MSAGDLKDHFKNAVEQVRCQARTASEAPPPRLKRSLRPPTEEEVKAKHDFFIGVIKGTRITDFTTLPTTLRAPWYKKPCAECGHTFRYGDPVIACPSPDCKAVYHQHPLHDLECFAVTFDHDGKCRCGLEITHAPAREAGVYRPPGPSMNAFIEGITSVLGDPAAETVVLPPSQEGQLCAVCGHTLRPKEVVLRCRCGHGPDRQCGALIHYDVARRMTCWLRWQQGRGRNRCPLTGQEFAS